MWILICLKTGGDRRSPIIFSFFNKFHNKVLITIFIIVISLYGIYFVLQDRFENEILHTLFEDQSKKQFDANKALSEHISSDLNLLLTKLETISKSVSIQDANYSSFSLAKALQSFYNNNSSILGKTDLLFLSDYNGLIKSAYPNSGLLIKSLFLKSDAGDPLTPAYDLLSQGDISSQPYFKKVKEFKKPLFFSGQTIFYDKNTITNKNNITEYSNSNRIIISYPIINEISGNFMGLIGLSISSSDFFENLGNIYDIKSQYMSVLDSNATHLVHSNANLVGKNFFDNYTQNFTEHNRDLNVLMHNVMSGKAGTVVYSIGNLGERLTTGFPIFLDAGSGNRLQYMVFVITPTSVIYSNVENKLFTQRVETISLLVIATLSIIILILFLSKWNRNLEKEIRKRTNELVKSNVDLKNITNKLQRTNTSLQISNKKVYESNKELELRNKQQREFINIAAHELRTPTQVIIGYLELALEDDYYKKVDESHGKYLEIVKNNANRLENLIENMLDVARIESNNLKLNKVETNLLDEIKGIIKEYHEQILSIKKNYGSIELNLITRPDLWFCEFSNNKTTDLSNSAIKDSTSIQNPSDLPLCKAYSIGGLELDDFTSGNNEIMVQIDRVRIYQVVVNLLNNAVKSILENWDNKSSDVKKIPSVTVSVCISKSISNKSELSITASESGKISDSVHSNSYESVSYLASENIGLEELGNKTQFKNMGEISSLQRTFHSYYAIIGVHDSGKGIPDHVLPRLFEKFASFSEKGTGLGLFISKGIIEAHGGKIWAFNNYGGIGATFSFCLPISSLRGVDFKQPLVNK